MGKRPWLVSSEAICEYGEARARDVEGACGREAVWSWPADRAFEGEDRLRSRIERYAPLWGASQSHAPWAWSITEECRKSLFRIAES